jgi:Tfp pilus assembly protein PilF
MGDRAMAANELAEASRRYRAALDVTPNSVVLLNNLAWLGGELGDSKALGYAEKAYALAPDSPEVMDTLGILLAKAGKPERGIEMLRRAVQAAPENNAIRLNLAKTLIQAGDKAAARKELEVLAVKGAQLPWKQEVDALLRGL